VKQSSPAQATTACFSRWWKFCSGHYRCCSEDLRADVERELEERTGAVHAVARAEHDHVIDFIRPEREALAQLVRHQAVEARAPAVHRSLWHRIVEAVLRQYTVQQPHQP
jgi:chorismate mutase